MKSPQGEEEGDGGGQDPAATASIINLFGMLSVSDFFHGPYERRQDRNSKKHNKPNKLFLIY